MGKLFKALLVVLLILILTVAITGIFLPSNYSVKRSIIINAKPAAIHEYVGDLKKWSEWQPWKEKDPTIVVIPGEKTSGIGASQSWVGKDGDGYLILTSSSPAKGIEYDLFFDDGKCECKSAMVYEPMEGGQTKVTWSMEGSMYNPIIGGYFALFIDSIAGPAFERGLERLKTHVEESHKFSIGVIDPK